MATDFFIKTGDTAPAIVAVLKDAVGTIVDLTDSSVLFIMRDKITNEKVVESAADILNPTGGQLSYQWQTGDTDTPDTYKAEFEVSFLDGTIETFPNSTYIFVKVVQDLGGLVP